MKMIIFHLYEENIMESKKLRKKPVRYRSRIEIEKIIKEHCIDRNRFYECSKNKYQKVINNFYYSFADHAEYPDIHLNYLWLHFRKNLKKVFFQYDNDDLLDNIKQYFIYRKTPKLFLILSDGWVYEGYTDEVITVLSEAYGLIEDFYIITPKFDAFVVYCSDGDCAEIYEKN